MLPTIGAKRLAQLEAPDLAKLAALLAGRDGKDYMLQVSRWLGHHSLSFAGDPRVGGARDPPSQPNAA